MDLQVFPPILWVSFSFSNSVSDAQVLKFSSSPIIFFPFLLMFLVSYQKNPCQIQYHEDYFLCFILTVL